jgi:hypothetical protein
MRPSARRTISVLSGLRTVLADLTACDPADRPAAGPAAKILDGIAAGFDGSLSDEILMLGQPASEPDRPLLRRTFCSRRRRIIVAAVVLGGCGAFTATLGSSDSRPSEPPQAAPRAAAASLPRAPQNPPQVRAAEDRATASAVTRASLGAGSARRRDASWRHDRRRSRCRFAQAAPRASGQARQGGARQGGAGQGRTQEGRTRRGRTRRGRTRWGRTRWGRAREGPVGQSPGVRGLAGFGGTRRPDTTTRSRWSAGACADRPGVRRRRECRHVPRARRSTVA